MYKQLTKVFPTVEAFISAYSQGELEEYLVVGKSLKGKVFYINGERRILESGDVLIAFTWNCNSYRIPGIGFKHCSEISNI